MAEKMATSDRCCAIFELDIYLIRDLSRIIETYVGEKPHDRNLVKQISKSIVSHSWDQEACFQWFQIQPCHDHCFNLLHFECHRLDTVLFPQFTAPECLYQGHPWYVKMKLVKVWKSPKPVTKNCFAVFSEWKLSGCGDNSSYIWQFLVRRTPQETRQAFRKRTIICDWDYQSISISRTFSAFAQFREEPELARILLDLLPRG